jgi:DNA-binding GntR family transcriptional regulator
VRPLDREEIAAFFEIRAALEALAARRLAERADAAWIERLEEAESALERRIAEGAGAPEQRELNAHFHRILYLASANPLLPRVVDDLEALTARRVLHHLYERADPQVTIRDHRALLAAIRDGDAGAAARLAATHVTRAASHLLA